MAGITAESIAVLAQTFGIVALAEFGDKTQLAALSFATKYRHSLVFAAMVAGFAVADGAAVVAGEFVFNYAPLNVVRVVAGALFAALGIWTLFSKEDDDGDEIEAKKNHAGTFAMVFGSAALMELGDKTQLTALGLSAESGQMLMVFLGTVGAMALMTALGIIAGKYIAKHAPKKWIKIGSGALFVIFGVLFLLQAFGISGA